MTHGDLNALSRYRAIDGNDQERRVTETVDVYLLAPEEDRLIELRDFTIMKPKCNKMDRIIHLYRNCEITYETTPIPVAKPSSPTIAPRHNGGFSNPRRNAAIFRLKQQLLQDYLYHDNTTIHSTYRRPSSPSSWTVKRRIPRYKPLPIGDEETIPLTTDWSKRVQYIESLWPVSPVQDLEEIRDYYGIQVDIVPNEKPMKDEEKMVEPNVVEDEKTRSSVPEMNPIATSQDDWVQCDKCSKWRRLPNHVNVSDLPATWYCKLNRWDKRYSKCSIPEENVVISDKEIDMNAFRERSYVAGFLRRIKRMEKAMIQYKYIDPKEDTKEREVVQCFECFKWRPLISGMDPSKIANPFVCWMNNWDEIHASCSARQGYIPQDEKGTTYLMSQIREEGGEPSRIKSNGASMNSKKTTSNGSKRKPSESTSQNSISNAKRPKRR